MKFIDLPTTFTDMTTSISLTGLTALKHTRYKTRHSGSKEITQIPLKGFILQPKQKIRTLGRNFRKKELPKEKIPRSYIINKKEVTHRIRNFVHQMSGEKMLYFWTITFPPSTSDNTAFILLNKWLTRLRQEKMIKEYLWISERQDGKRLTDKTQAPTNTLHFHIAINRKMDVKKANKYMRASIMHCINDGSIQYDRSTATRYNGVHIAKDRKTGRVINFAKQNRQKSLSNYLTKYVTKNNERFTHLAWHSSREYSNLIIAIRFTESEIFNSNLMNLVNMETKLEGQYYIFYRWKGSPPPALINYLSQLNNSIQSQLN